MCKFQHTRSTSLFWSTLRRPPNVGFRRFWPLFGQKRVYTTHRNHQISLKTHENTLKSLLSDEVRFWLVSLLTALSSLLLLTESARGSSKPFKTRQNHRFFTQNHGFWWNLIQIWCLNHNVQYASTGCLPLNTHLTPYEGPPDDSIPMFTMITQPISTQILQVSALIDSDRNTSSPAIFKLHMSFKLGMLNRTPLHTCFDMNRTHWNTLETPKITQNGRFQPVFDGSRDLLSWAYLCWP